MDYQFPRQLFPSFYNCGPPDLVRKHSAGNWGCYDRVRAESGPGPPSTWTFTSKHHVRGEVWRHSEPVPVPLLTPKNAFLWPSTPPDPLDFRDHMQNFFMDHSQDAFGCMSDILSENFNFKEGRKEKHRRDSVKMGKVQNFLDLLNFKICQQTFQRRTMTKYSVLLWDVVHTIPPELLGSLLHEELTEQRDRLLFCEGATGGALAFVPFSESGSQHGCLLYPGNKGLDRLNFHKVEVRPHSTGPSFVDTSSSKPFSFQLRGPVRQISVASLFNDCCVAVRSDHFCGVWRFSERNEPRSLQVVNTTEVATCINVSPHVLGEVLVASESGAANLWTVGKGMQNIRKEDTNLYFNARSPWRWCEFSAHPRVMLYADRTGAELTDLRVRPASGHTLFRISSISECRSGERLILSRYLGDVHPFHHLVTTQYSAYIMDERFPCVPMLKWDHMMQAPPVFCHIVPSSASSGSGTTKVLLGSHSSQEITLLQYSGGRAEASSSRGPPQALLRPKDSLKHLPVQLPHRHDIATNRLIVPAAGLTCIQKKAGKGPSGQECMCVLQLTEAGDIFYQILEPEQPGPSSSQPPAAEDEVQPQQRSRKLQQAPLKEAAASGRNASEQLPPGSQQTVSDTSSDEGIIGPTQGLTVQRTVAETPERERASSVYSDSDSEDSESRGRSRSLRRLGLQVVVNEDPELDPVSGPDEDMEDGNKAEDKTDDREERHDEQETVNSSSSESRPPRQTSVKLSSSALVTWKHWLQKLMQKSSAKTPGPRRLQHLTVQTEGLLHGSDNHADSSEKKRLLSLRKDLRSSMMRRSLLVNSSTSVGAPGLVPVPNPVDPEAWTDTLSQRLTLSWQEGEEAWRAWWVDKLGLNREAKVQALRRKRRKEKEARRAAGHRFDLSGSFTSSVSYQSELDDFSSSGWSSCPTQGVWSDTERSIISTPSRVQNDSLVPTPTNTPQRFKEKQGERSTPSRSRFLSPSPRPDATPVGQRRSKRPADHYLSSLFPPQDEPSQSDGYTLDEGSTMQPPPLHAASSPSVPVRSIRVDLSQSLSLSQSSQARQGSSQSSQPKKKSRMGF